MTDRPAVLVADDDPATRLLLAEVLEHDLGVRVAVVADGRAAIAALSRWRPDALVLDVLMPVVDGLAVLRWLQTRPPAGRPPVLALTAGIETHATAARALGAAAVLRKPFDLDELVAAVRPFIHRAGRGR